MGHSLGHDDARRDALPSQELGTPLPLRIVHETFNNTLNAFKSNI
jgi:hypothetical protein